MKCILLLLLACTFKNTSAQTDKKGLDTIKVVAIVTLPANEIWDHVYDTSYDNSIVCGMRAKKGWEVRNWTYNFDDGLLRPFHVSYLSVDKKTLLDSVWTAKKYDW